MKTLITPAMAQDILSRNTNNRLPTASLVALLADEMRNGKFLYNGESIIIGNNGTLLDGQHRLLAIVSSGVSVYVNLVEGVDESVMHTIDTGKSRSAGNVFQIKNIPNANNMASAIRFIVEEFGLKQKKFLKTDINTKSKGGNIKITNGEKLDFYNKHSTLLAPMMAYCLSLYGSNIRVLTPSTSTAYLWLLSIEDSCAKYFIRELFTGVQEGVSNAAILLHRKLVNNKLSASRLASKEIVNMVIYAFRAYKEEKHLKIFKGGISSVGKLMFDTSDLLPKLNASDFNAETK